MHPFYQRANKLMKERKTNRKQFCEKYDIPYSTLQSYWGTDKLMPGDYMWKFSEWLRASLDFLVWGSTEGDLAYRPAIQRVILYLSSFPDETILEILGMVKYITSSTRGKEIATELGLLAHPEQLDRDLSDQDLAELEELME